MGIIFLRSEKRSFDFGSFAVAGGAGAFGGTVAPGDEGYPGEEIAHEQPEEGLDLQVGRAPGDDALDDDGEEPVAQVEPDELLEGGLELRRLVVRHHGFQESGAFVHRKHRFL